jgi:2-isopropylmalate synthase
MTDDTVYIFDTTLRDGEQSPGSSMSTDEKITFAKQLARLGVNVIESGFPVSSPVQFEASKRIANEISGPIITGLARSVEKDIKAAYDAVKDAQKHRIHTFIATSPIHMKHKFNLSPDEILKRAVNSVEYAKSLCGDVEWSAEDATRSEIDFLAEIVEAVIEAGATVVNIPDTVGYSVPHEFEFMIKELFNRVKNINQAVISVHCHNDLGLAVANSLAAVRAGARQVECTINGIGERAGNASLEEIVMALHVRNNHYGVTTDIKTQELYRSSTLLSNIIGYGVQPNKAIVGKNAFSHESGIHQDGYLKNSMTYEIMTPELVGRKKSELVLGRHSGKAGFKARVKELGFELSEEQLQKAYESFLVVADKKKEVYDDDLTAILANEFGVQQKGYFLKYMSCVSGKEVVPTASVIIEKINGDEPETFKEAATGDGPVDAVYNAIDRITGLNVELMDYRIHAVTKGQDAQGEVSVMIKIQDEIYHGSGLSTDIIEASAKAYLNAISRMVVVDKKY